MVKNCHLHFSEQNIVFPLFEQEPKTQKNLHTFNLKLTKFIRQLS